jgi:hypothetical protein
VIFIGQTETAMHAPSAITNGPVVAKSPEGSDAPSPKATTSIRVTSYLVRHHVIVAVKSGGARGERSQTELLQLVRDENADLRLADTGTAD